MVEIRSTREERGGAALRQKNKLVCLKGAPISSIYRGGGGVVTLEEGADQGGALGFPSTWWRCPRVSPKGPLALQVEAPPMGLLGPSGSLPTWAFQVRGGPSIFNHFY